MVTCSIMEAVAIDASLFLKGRSLDFRHTVLSRGQEQRVFKI